MSDLYVFDTSSFVRAWHEAYPIDVVETFWELLDGAMAVGIIVSPDEVLRETSKRSDGLHKWLKEREGKCIVPIDEALEAAVGELLGKHERMAMNRKGASSADAWVVALAQLRGATVISEEDLADSQKRPKIPGVCKADRPGVSGTARVFSPYRGRRLGATTRTIGVIRQRCSRMAKPGCGDAGKSAHISELQVPGGTRPAA